jgi:hypothetical protein
MTNSYSRSRLISWQIKGSFFGLDALMQQLRLLDSKISGPVGLENAILLNTQLDGTDISGELAVRIRHYLFSVKFSKVGSALDLSGSEARCAYHLKKNEIGELIAVQYGFGSVTGSSTQSLIYDWHRKKELVSSPNKGKNQEAQGILEKASLLRLR